LSDKNIGVQINVGCRYRVTYNGLGIAEVVEFEKQKLNNR